VKGLTKSAGLTTAAVIFWLMQDLLMVLNLVLIIIGLCRIIKSDEGSKDMRKYKGELWMIWLHFIAYSIYALCYVFLSLMLYISPITDDEKKYEARWKFRFILYISSFTFSEITFLFILWKFSAPEQQ
jgi:peptidoglycan/LPS O-acetylase OafA/YrhL